MSNQGRPGYEDAKGIIYRGFDGGAILAEGTTVPTDATTGYSPGCIFFKRAGGATTSFYRNVGTLVSCNFDALALADIDFSTITATAAELNGLDADLANNILQPGVGITNGSGTVFKSSISRNGGIIITRILIDLTGLNGGGTAGDIIGVDGAGAAYLGQLTVAKNGIVWGGRMQCLETPATSNVDVDLWSADEATGVEDTAISALTNEVQLINHGNWAVADAIAPLTLVPVANQYLYLTSGAATSATFTAGQFLIEFFGY